MWRICLGYFGFVSLSLFRELAAAENNILPVKSPGYHTTELNTVYAAHYNLSSLYAQAVKTILPSHGSCTVQNLILLKLCDKKETLAFILFTRVAHLT